MFRICLACRKRHCRNRLYLELSTSSASAPNRNSCVVLETNNNRSFRGQPGLTGIVRYIWALWGTYGHCKGSMGIVRYVWALWGMYGHCEVHMGIVRYVWALWGTYEGGCGCERRASANHDQQKQTNHDPDTGTFFSPVLGSSSDSWIYLSLRGLFCMVLCVDYHSIHRSCVLPVTYYFLWLQPYLCSWTRHFLCASNFIWNTKSLFMFLVCMVWSHRKGCSNISTQWEG